MTTQKSKRVYDTVLTVRVNKGVLARARKVARKQGMTLSEYIREGLRQLADRD